MKPVEETGRRVLPDAVADRIREAILDGEFAPGDRLPPERELAEQLHVNRSSIREALKKLEQLRLVEIQQGSGIRVCAIENASFDLVWDLIARSGTRDRRWMEGLLELREALFPGIVRVAMNRASPADLRKTAAKVHEFMQRDYSDREFIQLLRTLQDDLAELTGNPVLKIFSNALQRGADATPVERWLSAERRKITPLVLRVAVAVEAGDVDTAERATREITRRVNQAVIAAMTREESEHLPNEPS
ncbi:MAG: FadR family transcriptional regulator [Deltaproteobacteria bacterium]|nr:FadR family transcriptional regulator [Deltaproteobacteria bacterium]MBW2413101.1 FadR family transcriptional regulator [Deltaproteobacteria bacterium]